jgi:hypothetical protein
MSGSKWTWAALIVVILMLGVGGTLVSSSHTAGAASPPAGAVPPARVSVQVHPHATDVVDPTTGSGGFTNEFSVGLGTGNVYFYAYDPSDSSAQVTITDQNATRDGVADPAATFVVSFAHSATNYSYMFHTYYQIPYTLKVGGFWNLTITGAVAGAYSTAFYVHTYDVVTFTDQAYYLPGHTGNVTWQVRNTVNGSFASGITTVQARGTYRAINGTFEPLFPAGSPTLAAGSTGTFPVAIPINARANSYLEIELWANVTGPTANYSERGFVSLAVGTLAATTITLGTCPTGCGSSPFPANSLLFLEVDQWIAFDGYSEVPVSGMRVSLSFLAGTSPVTSVPGNPPLSQLTNATGGFSALFLADPTVFSTHLTNTIVVNVTDPVDAATTVSTNVSFDVLVPTPGTAFVDLSVGMLQYYSGDTVTATWSIGGTSSTAAQGWVADSWIVFSSTTDGLLASGVITSTSSSGTFTYTIPLSYQGGLEFVVYTHNQTEESGAETSADVISPQILLTPNEYYYTAGDALSVGFSTSGSAFQGATYYGNVVDNGVTYFSGVISGSSFGITVPKVGTPTALTFLVAAQSPTLGLIATAQVTLYQASGVEIVAGIATASSYSDGSYQPGQTISLHYSISVTGGIVLPKAFRIWVYTGAYFGTGAGSLVFDTSSTSGTVSYTLPSGLPAGSQLIEVEVEYLGCGEYSCSSETVFSVPVNPNPSPLSYEIGAGSGVTVAWLIVVVLIVVVALLVWRGFRGRRRPVMMAPLTPAPTFPGAAAPSAAPAPAPSPGPSDPPTGATSPSWKESDAGAPPTPSSSDTPPGSPPLPSPPEQR